MLAEFVARLLDRLADRFQRILRALEVRRETPFVANRSREAALLQKHFERVKDFAAGAQCLRETRQAFRHDHELLKIDRRIRVRAAVDDVHHRHRQHARVGSPEIFEERQTELRGRGVGVCERNGKDCVRARVDLFAVPSSSTIARSTRI